MLGGAGIGLGLRGKVTNAIGLQAGATYIIPAGNYLMTLGPYTCLQYLDPVTGIWRTVLACGPGGDVASQIQCDGANQRLANLTGCPVGAVITQGTASLGTTGIGTTATTLTVTPSTGGSTWCPIVGGAISASCVTGVTGSTVGAGYLYPPTAIISAPPPGGLQATAHVTGIPTTAALLAGQVIIDNQGAGYPVKSTGISTATVTFVNDPRDTTGGGATVQLGATGTGSLTGLYPLNQGLPNTVVPTLSFSAGSAAATSVMNFTVTTFTTGLTGLAFLTGSTPMLTSVGNLCSATPIWTNPLHMGGITFPRPARLVANLSGATLTVATSVVEDGGFGIQQIPSFAISGIGVTGAVAGAVNLVPTVGGVADTSWLQPV